MHKKIIPLLFFGFVFRILLVPIAHHGDLNNNISWGNIAIRDGFVDYYEAKNWPYSSPNQPPLTILMFSGTSYVWQAVENLSWWANNRFSIFPSSFIWFWEDKGMLYLVKLPSIVADLGVSVLIFWYFAQKKKEKTGLVLMLIWLANPITWYSSSIWGQTDSIVNFLGLISIIAITRKRLTIALPFFVASLLFKGSLSLFLPILIFYAFLQKYKVETWIKAVVLSILVVLLASIWFHPYWDIFLWLPNLYINRFFPGEIGFLTANAFNFWWLVDAGKTLDSKMFFFLTARQWGIFAMLNFLFFLIFKIKKNNSEKVAFYALMLLGLGSFLFMTRIHERYLYPFFPMATILVGFIPSLFVSYLLLSVIHLLNLYHLFWAPGIPALESLYSYPAFPQMLSVASILIFVYLLYKFAKLGN